MLQKITALRVQKRNRHRVNVYLDGRYAFGLQSPVAVSLKVGQTLSVEEIAQLQDGDSAEVAHDRALHFLEFRPRSRSEVEAYLSRRGASSATVGIVVSRLAEAGLLDDEAFARYWIENREAFRPRGVRSLRFELRRKGLSDSVVDGATEGIDETDSAYRAALQKARRWNCLDYYVFRRRLGGFLQRRGFDYGIVKEAVERVWRELRSTTEEDLS